MKPTQILLLFWGVLILLALVAGGCVYQGYNRAVGLDENVNSRWAQIENQLQRRYDLIPNLIETVKGIAGQEQEVFLGVAEARTKYFQTEQSGSREEQIEAAGDLERTLSRLLMLREAYPELRSNESFLTLQSQLEGTENRLSVERKRYNDSVESLNRFTRQFPSRFYANLAEVEPAEYFEIEPEVEATPEVDFSGLREDNAASGEGDR